MLIGDGYARITFVKDVHGGDLETAYYGVDGKPVVLKQGYARVVRNYDEYGDLVAEAYLDTDGHLALKNCAFARFVRINDRHGRLVEGRFYGLDDLPTTKNSLGAPRFTISYGQGDQIIERLLHHKNGLIEHQRLQNTDPFGSAAETTVTDSTGKLVDGPDGYARCSFVGKEPNCANGAGEPVVEVAVIEEVAMDQPAERALRKGDIVVGPLASPEQAAMPAAAVGEAEQRVLVIIRDGHRQTVQVPSGKLVSRTHRFFVSPAGLAAP